MEEDDFICWLSEDPDDWYSLADYDRIIVRLVLEYNEEAFCLGEPLVGLPRSNILEMTRLLETISTDAQVYPHLKNILREIQTWASRRMRSSHPDTSSWMEFQNRKGLESFQNGEKLLASNSVAEAILQYETSALYDHPQGYERLGRLFEKGLYGIETDIAKAIKYYEAGVEDDMSSCAYHLGCLYLDGTDSLIPNKGKAYTYFRQAALLDNQDAEKMLARCYESGWGCDKDWEKALYWYDISIIGINDGNRIRRMLKNLGDGEMITVDGVDYKARRIVQEVTWWRAYYSEKGLC